MRPILSSKGQSSQSHGSKVLKVFRVPVFHFMHRSPRSGGGQYDAIKLLMQ